MRQIIATLGLVLLSAAAYAQPSTKTFDMYVIDTEGGHSTLYVSPTGETLLEDAGNPGTRDPDRIMAVIHAAGVTQIDHMIITHYHVDHVGGVEEIAKRIPIKHFIDHGATVEQPEQVRGFQAMYAGLYSKVQHTVAKPGDKIALGAVDVTVVTSAKEVIKKALPGGGIPNPACAEYKDRDDSDTQAENKESVGVVYTYGKYRSVNLGDFTWNQEAQLMCPNNPIGHVSLLLTPHHGINQSNSVALIHGLAPEVVIMHNSTRKGGAPTTMQDVWTSPGLQDFWQLHWAYGAGLDNTPERFIANIEDPKTVADVITGVIPAGGGFGGGGRGGSGGGRGGSGRGPGGGPGGPPPGFAAGGSGGRGGGRGPQVGGHDGPAFYIKVSAHSDGSFTVLNTRNNFSKTYAPMAK